MKNLINILKKYSETFIILGALCSSLVYYKTKLDQVEKNTVNYEKLVKFENETTIKLVKIESKIDELIEYKKENNAWLRTIINNYEK